MQNGLYDIRLTAEDASGNLETVDTVYQIDGNMKIGIFTLTFTDLTIPVPSTGSGQTSNDVHYTLLSREKGVSVWDTLAEGTTTSPLSGVLTTFDPTIYRNGIHEIRLWAEDTAGNEAFVDGCLLMKTYYLISRDRKLVVLRLGDGATVFF